MNLKELKTNAIEAGVWVIVGAVMAPTLLAVAVLFLQCLAWMRHAAWQQVPVGALFLSADGQRMLYTVPAKMSPLDIVPALGTGFSMDQTAWFLAGKMEGMQKILVWVLDTPFTVWMCVLSIAILTTATSIKGSK